MAVPKIKSVKNERANLDGNPYFLHSSKRNFEEFQHMYSMHKVLSRPSHTYMFIEMILVPRLLHLIVNVRSPQLYNRYSCEIAGAALKINDELQFSVKNTH